MEDAGDSDVCALCVFGCCGLWRFSVKKIINY